MNNNYKNNYTNNNYGYNTNYNTREETYEDTYSEDSYDTQYEYSDYDYSYSNNNQRHSYEKRRTKPPKKKKPLLKVLVSIVAVLICFVMIFALIGWCMSLFVPVETNFLIMATDQEGTRTDTIMFGTFNKNTKAINLVSIPRDTYVTVDENAYDKMNSEFPQPSGRSMKINSIHHFGGDKYGVPLLVNEVEKITDRKIDFYIKVDFDAFKYIVDAVGGIEFYVPQDMEYHDPYQDLHISLKEGMQRLNGEEAEQLVRFRSGYANADLGRIEVQQQFMKAFIQQTVSKRTIASNPGLFFDVIFKYDYVNTNAEFFDVLSYCFVIGGIEADKINTHTLPGTESYVSRQSVYQIDISETAAFVDEILSK